MDALGLVALVAHLDRVRTQSSSRTTSMSDTQIVHTGRIANEDGHFRDVMREFPYEKLWELLNDPQPIDDATFEYVINWCRPRIVKDHTFVEAVLDSRLLETRSEVFRKVKEGGMKWNGKRVTDVNMPIEFLEPGWGVIQLGKKTHKVILDRGWCYADPNTRRGGSPIPETARQGTQRAGANPARPASIWQQPPRTGILFDAPIG